MKKTHANEKFNSDLDEIITSYSDTKQILGEIVPKEHEINFEDEKTIFAEPYPVLLAH